MIILVLIAVQYFQNFVFSFEKVSNVQNHSSSDSHQTIIHPAFSNSGGFPSLINAIWKTVLFIFSGGIEMEYWLEIG